MEPFRFPYKVPCAAEQRAENWRMLECISRYMHFADADTVTPSAVAPPTSLCGKRSARALPIATGSRTPCFVTSTAHSMHKY